MKNKYCIGDRFALVFDSEETGCILDIFLYNNKSYVLFEFDNGYLELYLFYDFQQFFKGI